MRYYCCFFFWLWTFCLSAKSVDTSLIRLQYQQAVKWCEKQNYATAESIAKQARKELLESEIENLDLSIGLNSVLADCAMETGGYSEALAFFQASKNLLELRQLTNGLPMAKVLNEIGFYYQETKEFERAIPYFERALVIRREALGLRHPKIADLYNNLGVCKNALGDHDKALEFHDQALSIRLEMLPAFHPRIAQSYNNLGVCLERKGEFQLALRNYQKAIRYYQKHAASHRLALADVYVNVGPVYQHLGDPQRNIDFLMKALKIYQQQLKEDHPTLAICYNNLGNAYVNQERFRTARLMYEKALEIRKLRYGNTHPDVAQTYFNMGVCHFRQGETQQAEAVFQQCFRALNYRPDPNPEFEQVSDHYTLILLFYHLSEIHKEYYNRSSMPEDLLPAFAYYQQADQLIDFLRDRYEAVGSKLELADLSHQLYDLAINLAIDLFHLTGEESYGHKAFEFSEKSKGLLLLDALYKTSAEYFAGVPDTILEKMDDLEFQIAELEKKRYLSWEKLKTGKENLTDSLSNLIFEKKQQVSSLIKEVETHFPRYYDLRYNTAAMPISQVQKKLLEPGQSLVEYFLGDTYLHIFVINKNEFDVFRITLKEDFWAWLRAFRSAIRQFPNVSNRDLPQNTQHYVRSAFLLYQDLIKPIEHLLEEELILIPDGELELLPFGALLSEFPDTTFSFKNLSYLLRDYAVSYNYSATLLREMKGKQKGKSLAPYLGLAPTFEPENSNGLSQLRFNKEEVQDVQHLVGGQVFTGPEATKARFLSDQDGYKIIHLATHGKANSSSSDFSFLAFSESPSEKGEEALLYTGEIYKMSSQAEMIVLSACETGIGELQQGEGMASIARGFSYAGARSMVATQWSVEDKATKKLIYLFFKELKDGRSKNQALRKAKLDFIASSGQRASHPYFWASFIPVGNMERIAFGLTVPLGVGLIPLAVLFYLGFVWRKRKRKNPPEVN